MIQEMSPSQCAYIMRLLDMRYVSARVASRIIQMLEDQPVLGDTGMSTDFIKQQLNDARHTEEIQEPPDDWYD
jgi:hypothetical protein